MDTMPAKVLCPQDMRQRMLQRRAGVSASGARTSDPCLQTPRSVSPNSHWSPSKSNRPDGTLRGWPSANECPNRVRQDTAQCKWLPRPTHDHEPASIPRWVLGPGSVPTPSPRRRPAIPHSCLHSRNSVALGTRFRGQWVGISYATPLIHPSPQHSKWGWPFTGCGGGQGLQEMIMLREQPVWSWLDSGASKGFLCCGAA